MQYRSSNSQSLSLDIDANRGDGRWIGRRAEGRRYWWFGPGAGGVDVVVYAPQVDHPVERWGRSLDCRLSSTRVVIDRTR